MWEVLFGPKVKKNHPINERIYTLSLYFVEVSYIM